MKPKQPKNINLLMYNEAEGFNCLINEKPFCNTPAQYNELSRYKYESAMDQFDFLEDVQRDGIFYNFTYTLLKDKKVKVSGILFIEIVNQ